MEHQLEQPEEFTPPGLTELPEAWVAKCNWQHDAVRLCISHSRVDRTHAEWGRLIGTNGGHFTNLLNGGTRDRVCNFRDSQIETIQNEAGNQAVSQWWALMGKKQLIRQKSDQANRHR